jgi:hypothetical protein
MLQARVGNERQALRKAQSTKGELARAQNALRQVRAELENERKDRRDERDRFEGGLETLREGYRCAGRGRISLEVDADFE